MDTQPIGAPKKYPRLSAVFALLLVLPLALAQNAPTTALGWLDTARAFHGGTNLENLRGYRETGVFRVPATASRAQQDGNYVITADLTGERYRLEYAVNNVRFIQQFANNAGFIWTSPPNRREAAPAAALPTLRAPLYQGWLGLRFKTRDNATLLGTQTLGTQTGTAVRATTSGIVAQLLFSPGGELLAETTTSIANGTLTLEYRNSQVRSGVRVPLETRLISGTVLIATQLAQNTTINPIWTSADFSEP